MSSSSALGASSLTMPPYSARAADPDPPPATCASRCCEWAACSNPSTAQTAAANPDADEASPAAVGKSFWVSIESAGRSGKAESRNRNSRAAMSGRGMPLTSKESAAPRATVVCVCSAPSVSAQSRLCPRGCLAPCRSKTLFLIISLGPISRLPKRCRRRTRRPFDYTKQCAMPR